MSIEVAAQEYVAEFPLDELVDHPDNPRLHDIDGITESLETNDFAGAIYAQKSTKRVLSGHGRVKVLRAEDVKFAPVILIDCDDEQALKYLLAFNSVGEKSTYDEELLASLLVPLAEMGDIGGTGYTADDVDKLLSRTDTLVIPEVEFQGDYAETPDQAAERGKKVATTKASQGLRELVLVYDGDRFKRLSEALVKITEFFGADTNAEAVFDCVINFAKDL